jgi:hypothetical protein
MAEWYNDLHEYVNGQVPMYMFMEANATQDLIFVQVKMFINDHGWKFMVSGDYRVKGDKFSRIETALEPINSNGQLFLNAAEKDNPNMKRLEEQFLALEPSLAAHDDGPDAVEGAKWILDRKIISAKGIDLGKRGYNNKRF